MSAALRKLGALWRLGVAEATAYRASLLVWVLTTTFPLLSLVLWRALSEDGPIGGYDQRGFDSYFVAAFLVRQLSASWVIWDLDRQVRTGELSVLLLRPVNPVVHHAMLNLAALPLRSLLAAPIGILVLVATGGVELAEDPRIWLLAPLAVILAWALNFVTQLAIGCLAFWITKASSLYDLWLGAYIVLAGYVIPTSLFPAGLAEVARALPFHAALGFPTELIIGRLSLAEVGWGLGLQAAWLLALGLLAAWLWRTGLRAYGAFGA
ncbi:ABC-2 family transporter protein [Pseudenhygromyxa sp. WMMC2535]|uniref:ABC transporter permease n=1 Tax=Pseudenhygromyxa sp. WMMC2535 TaxID=2712867 RepID=UPI001553C77B|nr:ABC-2 family transporter protein [Pseudenhygromyxa sp. WMMC2535]NVB42118.1 ABC-2 family transporter protein [Pseudenhygromyxa sp. WMMC2535]